MESILQLDEALFHWINSGWQNSFLDTVLPYWREKKFWYPLYIGLLLFFLIRFQGNGLYLVLSLVLCVGLADICSSKVLKPSVKRIRPCNDPAMQADVRLLVGCGRAYSFTSSHAANHFAISFFLLATLGVRFRKIRGWLLAWAGSVAFAQVYVGVHYPLDVVSGSIVGIIIAKLFAFLYFISGKAIPEFGHKISSHVEHSVD